MNVIETLILGAVEGITEFLPISSTGHLILTSALLKLPSNEALETFEIFIQLGAILAVVFLYSHRFEMLFQRQRKVDFGGINGWKLLAVTSLPAMILGFLTHSFIKAHLFTPITVILALLIGGIAIILLERLNFNASTKTLDKLTMKQALVVGLFQCLALWPGMSRSASTIIGGLFAGLNRKTAAEYSFIAAVPIMIAATGYDLLKSWHSLQQHDWLYLALGFAAAFITAIVSVKFFIRFVQHSTLTAFGFYRILISIAYYWIFLH